MFQALVLALALTSQGTAPPETRRIEAAVVELTAAFGKGSTPQQRVQAIRRAAPVVDARVVERIEQGLSDRDAGVVSAAVEACGSMRHPAALDALQTFWKCERKRLEEDELLYPLLLKSIGRHGSPTSVSLLQEDPFAQRSYATVQARVMALGNIRSKQSVAALIEMSTLVGPYRMEGLRNDFRIALARLTGRDLGSDSTLWLSWWQENKKRFEVSPEPQAMDANLQRQWDRYWGTLEKGAATTGAPQPDRKRNSPGGKPRGG